MRRSAYSGQFTQTGHILVHSGGGWPLLREGGPISYQPTPDPSSPQVLEREVVVLSARSRAEGVALAAARSLTASLLQDVGARSDPGG